MNASSIYPFMLKLLVGSVISIQLILNGSSGAIALKLFTTRSTPFGPSIVSGSVLSALPSVSRSPGRPLT